MDFDAAFNFVRTEINKEIKVGSPVPKGYLEDFVKNRTAIKGILPSNIKEKLVKHLETYFGTFLGTGNSLKSDYREWYPVRKGELEFYFWRRLQKYWLEHAVMPVGVIDSVDKVTDEILGYLGDPKDSGSWKRRGLVMGHVQSGKTTNYSALITKAADAGYRIIIVLAGLTNSLRYQTQIRLDQTFVGRSSLADALNGEIYPVSYVFKGLEAEGAAYQIRHPYCGTTQARDFSTNTTQGVGATEGNFADPILFVTKKNEKVLTALAEWLGGLNNHNPLEGPMLLIDDEADNASVNTQKDPKKTTAINACIRSLLNCSRRTSYVGYTATPFANIFIDPDTEQEMLQEDLFPSHFIKSLDAPTNYIGAKQLFSNSADLAKVCVRPIPNDFDKALPLTHKEDWVVEDLPESLVDAVCEYVIFRSIRILSGEGDRHSSMLVNVSRFNRVQQRIRDLIYRWKQEMQQASDVWASTNRWESAAPLARLHEVWKREFCNVSRWSWGDILSVLRGAISSIDLRLVNMRGTGGLDYGKAPSTGLHIIAVGGLALARGLTLEGLAVSYVLRNVGAADTLLQIGRWFGYRDGYAELCRIHATAEMIQDFREVSDSVEELRADLVRMEKMGMRPEDFGLKVRRSPTGIAITAANKMRSAKPFVLAADYSTRHLQGFEVLNDAGVNRANLKAVDVLLSEIKGSRGGYVVEPGAVVFKGVPVEIILKFIAAFDLPQLDFAKDANGTSLVLNYIKDRAPNELMEWDVAIPFRRKMSIDDPLIPLPVVEEKGAFCRQRHSGVFHDGATKIVKMTEKNVVADFPKTDMVYGEDRDFLKKRCAVERARDSDLSEERIYASARSMPLLLVHLVDFRIGGNERNSKLKFDSKVPIATISLVLPGTKISPKPREYAASKRLMELMAEALMQSETDEEIDEVPE